MSILRFIRSLFGPPALEWDDLSPEMQVLVAEEMLAQNKRQREKEGLA